MTEMSFIIKLTFFNKNINWSDILGSQYMNWFVKIENIVSSERDFMFYSEDEADSQFVTFVKVSPDMFDMTEMYVLVDFNGESTTVNPVDTLFPSDMTAEDAKVWRYSELRKRGHLYKHEVFRLKMISMGDSILDNSFYRPSSIKFMHSIKEDYYAIVKFKAILIN